MFTKKPTIAKKPMFKLGGSKIGRGVGIPKIKINKGLVPMKLK